MDHNDRDIELSMGPLGRVTDGRYVIAVIQTLRTAMRALDNGTLTNIAVLVNVNEDNYGDVQHGILRDALCYSGLQTPERHTYMLSQYLYGLFVESGAPTTKASDGVRELDLETLAKCDTAVAKDIVREALYSLTDTIKFDANIYRMA